MPLPMMRESQARWPEIVGQQVQSAASIFPPTANKRMAVSLLMSTNGWLVLNRSPVLAQPCSRPEVEAFPEYYEQYFSHAMLGARSLL